MCYIMRSYSILLGRQLALWPADKKTELQQQSILGNALVSTTDLEEMTFVYHDLVLGGKNSDMEKSICHKNYVLISSLGLEKFL